MKIVCLNVWGGKLADDLLPWLAESQPDILCLQEVTHTPLSDQSILYYSDGNAELLQRANLFSEIKVVLPRHFAMFCPSAEGSLWHGDTEVASQFGIATFVRSDLAIVAQAQAFVHKSYEPGGFGAHPRARNVHVIRVFESSNQRSITVAHMHGLYDPKGKMDTPERLTQVNQLRALIKTIAEPADIQIVCGDFNVLPESETLRMLRDYGLTELVTSRGFQSTRTSHYPKPGKFADYMLVNNVAAIKSFDVIYNPEVSDHCPLVLEI